VSVASPVGATLLPLAPPKVISAPGMRISSEASTTPFRFSSRKATNVAERLTGVGLEVAPPPPPQAEVAAIMANSNGGVLMGTRMLRQAGQGLHGARLGGVGEPSLLPVDGPLDRVQETVARASETSP
jgi:hypothetical protein